MIASTMGRVGIDIGGTFTDAAIVQDDGRIRIAKVASTPVRIADGFLAALDQLLERSGEVAADVGYLAHGTTIATNAIVQRRLARTGLVTNEGFADILEIGTQMRRNVYDLWTAEAAPIVDRACCVGVRGRLAADGSEVEPLDETGVRAAAARLRERGVECVAVILLHSFLDSTHEERVGAILADELPGVPISLSSRVVPELREYLRAATTAANAALLPLVGTYIAALAAEIAAAGIRVPLHLMQSNGGVTDAVRARSLPIALAASGPAAGVIGGARLATAVGERDVLTFDMGGTTADIGLVVDGEPELRFSGDANGTPLNLPQIDVLCIGAGGGSIARVDGFGRLTVGPASAGAVPGPAGYGSGGTDATVTDAHLVLGTLAPGAGLAGGVGLDRELAAAAVQRAVATPLGLGLEEAAGAILRVANANMAGALRVMSVARGHDPRRFALVAIGGAGPMHACALADDLAIPRVVVPRFPGVAAALGLLVSDIRHDLRRSWPRVTAAITPAELDAELGRLSAEASELLEPSRSIATGTDLAFELDLRYRGQAYNLTVPLAAPPVTAASLAAAEAAFARQHERLYDYTPTITETEIVTVRLRATAQVPGTPWVVDADEPQAVAEAARQVWDGGWRSWRSVRRGDLAPGATIDPETVVVQEDATTVVARGWRGIVHAGGTIVLEQESSR